jgi:hypothetical protein
MVKPFTNLRRGGTKFVLWSLYIKLKPLSYTVALYIPLTMVNLAFQANWNWKACVSFMILSPKKHGFIFQHHPQIARWQSNTAMDKYMHDLNDIQMK